MYQGILAAICLAFSFNTFANDKADLAAAAYSQRDYTTEGVEKALESIELYKEAVTAETVETAKLQLMLDQATAHYFLGTAMDKKADRKEQHLMAIDMADAVLSQLGVDPKKAHELTKDEITALLNKYDEVHEYFIADAMYSKGINLSQWGNLQGPASAIGRLSEVTGVMERIGMMGYESIHEYGPYRTIGRIKFVLPTILGGDLKESEKFLIDAYRNSLAEGQRYSVNGYNNIYLAETLYKQGKETQGRRLIDTFLAADPATLKPNHEPENREALRVAQELHDKWH